MSDPALPRPCSIQRTVELLGPRWTWAVLRELTFAPSRFDAMVAATGAPRNLLADRLRTLQDAGLVQRRPYQERPRRYEYELTDLGREAAEVLLLLMRFGDRHLSDEPPVVWHHHPAGVEEHVLEVALVCRHCGRPAADGMTHPQGPGAPTLTQS